MVHHPLQGALLRATSSPQKDQREERIVSVCQHLGKGMGLGFLMQ